MIFLVHNQAKALAFCKKEGKELSLKAKTICEAFWELATLFPEELIIWIEEGQQSNFNKDSVSKMIPIISIKSNSSSSQPSAQSEFWVFSQ